MNRDATSTAQTPGGNDKTHVVIAAGDSQGSPRRMEECCDRCGSVRLIRVKACWRCEACGYKSDCNGW